MYLRRLEIVGFKSFASRTVTEFQPGIVVIVGPNGSGKSNVSDALLWVLGEQSAKAVRARKPEEVIFAGSASRQPLGMAEVSLVLDNTDASLPIEFDEVRVTRRLYRSGDSEYLLNGARVRLKDITQLLLHAGLSPDSYAVVGQGSIDELILQRPDERRVVFENVADIRRHQLRLTETRSKLASTQANLVRVQDILAELTPHVRRLKTQAERAERAEHFRSELHTLLLKTFRWRFLHARAIQRDADAEAARATREAENAVAETLAGEARVHEVDTRLGSMDERLTELRPRADAVREQVRAAERGLAVVHERLLSIEEQRSLAKADLVRLDGALERLHLEEADAASTHDANSDAPGTADAGDMAQAQASLAAAAAELERAQAQRGEQQARVDELDAAARDAEAQLARTSQHVHTLEASQAVDQARHADRDARLVALQQQLATLREEQLELQADREATETRLSAAARAHAEATARLEAVREQLRLTSQQADRLHGALDGLGATELNTADDSDLPPDWQSTLIGLPVVGVAAELAHRIPPIDLLLAGYLRRIVVMADDAAAHEAHRRLTSTLASDDAAWAVLSMDGLLLVGDGARPLTPASGSGQSALADWSRQVRALEADLKAAEASRHVALAEVQAARDSLDDTEANERGARVALGEIEARLAELRRAESAAQAELRDLETMRERAQRTADQRQAERERADTRLQAIQERLATVRAERQQVAQTLRAADDQLGGLTEHVAGLRGEVASLEAAAGRREAERAAREALHARILSEVASTAAARDSTRSRLAQLEQQAREVQARAADLERDMDVLKGELAPVEAELDSAESRRAEQLAERHAAEQHVAVMRAAERAAHEKREAHHVAAQRAADEVERIKTEIAETAELESELAGDSVWAEQLRLAFVEDGAEHEPREVFDVDAARRRIATLQRELRSIGGGGVAASVVEEYREMSERHAFLEHQSADLRAAMEDLESAANELETHMRERFAEAFTAIQTAFQECFSELFGGGEARLVLTDPDDLLRTGIDIVARPPGKKLQGLLSLSGGERALTVVSLLFGLLKINPTPFCVLDEVDAALDEANVLRFANLLAEFARRIQFIVVTHNRATMDKADAMYGVSMDAAGISHVFSVRPSSVAHGGDQRSAVSHQLVPAES